MKKMHQEFHLFVFCCCWFYQRISVFSCCSYSINVGYLSMNELEYLHVTSNMI